MGSSWYSSKELFEMMLDMQKEFSGLRTDVANLRTELTATRDILRQYNGLRERLDAMENQAIGRANIGRSIREWGGWLVAVLSFVMAVLMATQ